MVTDPTRSIRHKDHPFAFDIPAAELLERLADLPAQNDVPYLTVTLDWSVAGEAPGRREAEDVRRSEIRSDDAGSDRPSRRELELTLDRMIDEHGPRGDVFDALTASKERINEWITNELDPAAQGVYIVSHEPSGVFEATGLVMPIDTNISLSAMPRIYKLVRIIEDYPTYAVLQADQSEATLSFITRGVRNRSIVLDSTLYPTKQKQGGWSQKRFQKRADERVEAFARDTLEQVERALRDTGVETLILAGAEVMMSALNNQMSDNLKQLVREQIRMESVASEREKIEATMPIAEEAERERELASVERVLNGIGQGGRGVGGKHDTIRALQNGQVDTLVMVDTFEGHGWADYAMHAFGADDLPTEHPLGGNVADLVEVDLADEMVRLALASGAEVDIIHSSVPYEDSEEIRSTSDQMPITEAAAKMRELGDVGAVLRFTMDGDAPSQRT